MTYPNPNTIALESRLFAENWRVAFDEGSFELSAWDSNTESWCELKVFGGDQALKMQKFVTILWENGELETDVQDWIHAAIQILLFWLRNGRKF